MKKKKKWIVLAVVLLLVGAGIFGCLRMAADAIPVLPVGGAHQGDLETSLSISGQVTSGTTKTFFSPGSVKVKAVACQVGDTVTQGEILIEYDAEDMADSLSQLALQHENAKLQYEDTYRKMTETQQDYTDAEDDIDAIQDDIDFFQEKLDKELEESWPDEERVQKYTEKVATLKQDLAILKQKKESLDSALKSFSEQSFQMLQNQIDLAAINYNMAAENYIEGNSQVEAPFDGVVTQLAALEGATTAPGQTIITLADSSDIRIAVALSKYDLSRVELGQQAVVTFGNHRYEGVVSHIDAVAQMVGTATVVQAEITVAEPDEALRLGVETDVEIKTFKSSNVTLLPVEAVKVDRNGEYCYIAVPVDDKERFRPEKLYLETGNSSDFDIEILSGLEGDEKVILNPPSNISAENYFFKIQAGE